MQTNGDNSQRLQRFWDYFIVVRILKAFILVSLDGKLFLKSL
jgi:hypothetical protein